MCEYMNMENGQCKILKNTCPYLYFCNRIKKYKVNSSFSEKCKVKQNFEIPKGYYKVCFQRRGKLYISIDGFVQIIENPYDFIPEYVKISKLKNGVLKIKDAK